MLRGPWIQTETAVTSTECSSDKGGIQVKLLVVLLSCVVSALSRMLYFVSAHCRPGLLAAKVAAGQCCIQTSMKLNPVFYNKFPKHSHLSPLGRETE